MGSPIAEAIPRAEIRRAIVFRAFCFWCAGIWLGLIFGKSFPQAISNSTAGAIGGLSGWAAYHVVSRRNDFQGLLPMGMMLIMMKQDAPFLPAVGSLLLALIPYAWFFGMVNRGRERGESVEKSNNPMHDAVTD